MGILAIYYMCFVYIKTKKKTFEWWICDCKQAIMSVGVHARRLFKFFQSFWCFEVNKYVRIGHELDRLLRFSFDYAKCESHMCEKLRRDCWALSLLTLTIGAAATLAIYLKKI